MRLAGHLGVRAPDAPLLRHMAGSGDAVSQIALLAELGFAGVSDNYLTLRSPEEQERIGDALAQHGLTMGSFVHDPLRWNEPTWSTCGTALSNAVDISLAAAKRCGSTTINCITGRNPDQLLANQYTQMAENLRWQGDRALSAGVTLCVEATHPTFAPGLLIEKWQDACALVCTVDHPAVLMNLDIGHVALHGDDVIAAIDGAAPWLGMVQAADVPGRVEPGAGNLDWTAIAAALDRAQYRGLVELELEPADDGEVGERAMLTRLTDLGLLPVLG
ncbi:sugar phosphate isomerase/epimerase [Sphingomonas paeninsulae]|uniref:Sugar phosphate isomerase/epimerase n=1 Tax=Sphingomonas paeninsulae TaxID=2319844 RepID=A0A494TMR1_SPHPE|nr:sugar phosphate isomerase/epimerase family protein [Sphingomonas paeninsulae]AYJ87096.1 sugar phosphate isomerase/epimerase [Sphingomonas paeninsulae]